MRNALKISAVIIVLVLLVSCSAPKKEDEWVSFDEVTEHTTTSWVTEPTGPLKIYEMPEIVFIKVVDNHELVEATRYDGVLYIYYLFEKNGDVYEYDEPDLEWEQMIEKFSDGSLSDRIKKVRSVTDKEGYQNCIDKFQGILNNRNFSVDNPGYGLDWGNINISWYGLYYDDDHNLTSKKFWYLEDLEVIYIPSDPRADEIKEWLDPYTQF